MDGMAMVTTLKSNAARNTAASTTASAYQRRELMDMACRFAGSVPVGATLLTLDLHLCHCRLPRTSARPSARSAPAQRSGRGPRSEEHTSELQSRSDLVCRLLLEKKKEKTLQMARLD